MENRPCQLWTLCEILASTGNMHGVNRCRTVFPQALFTGEDNSMAVAVKSADAIAKKYVARASAATADYTSGVTNTSKDWAALTTAAAPTWATGVQQAVTNGMFQRGVSNAGTAKWKSKASTLGAQRYGPGVSAASADYQNGIAPYLAVIAALTLPPRGAKGDPGNLQRVSVIAAALRAKKVSG